MSSILTNNSAMVALQTLKGINKSLEMTQSEISTGKAVASAKDNSAIWAISKQMESDVSGFKAISESLNLGQSTVAVAANAAETTTDLLQQMKEQIVAAQEDNVDRDKIQTDIQQLARQINSVTTAAQFNGLNLVRGGDDIDILSSLDRASDGSVTSSSISVERQDLSEAADVAGAGVKSAIGTLSDTDTDASLTAADQTLVATVTASNDETLTLTLNDVEIRFTQDGTATAEEGRDGLISAFNALKEVDSRLANISLGTTATAAEIEITNESNLSAVSVAGAGTGASNVALAGGATEIARSGETITFAENASVNEGDSFTIGVPGGDIIYVARSGDTAEDVANGLVAAVQASGNAVLEAGVEKDGTDYVVSLGTTGTVDLGVTFTENADGQAGGDLFGLSAIDVTTDTGAANALGLVETLIDRTIDAAAELGSSQGRIEIQSDFISKLTDSLKSGIGALVDADLEETSARLQALQVQQQLATQSLSIANQAPQALLSLFR